MPQIDTVAAFTRTLLEAKSVAYRDPAASGSSGIYVAGMSRRLGIAEAVAGKSVLVHGGQVGQPVADGTAALGIHQISELLQVPGLSYIGPLPPELQNYTRYAGGLAAGTSNPDEAAALPRYLASPEATPIPRTNGMEPTMP